MDEKFIFRMFRITPTKFEERLKMVVPSIIQNRRRNGK